MKVKITLTSVMLGISLLVVAPTANAITVEEIAVVSVYPDDGFKFKLKRLKEKIVMIIKFSESSKVDYQQQLLGRRLSELKHIVINDNRAYIETTSQRYEATAGQLTESIIANNLDDKKDFTSRLFASHSEALNELKENYSFETAEYRFVMNDINSLKIYSNSLRPE